jgi:hypothetical protein
MAPELSREAAVTGTTTQRPYEHGSYVGRVDLTHIHSANPLCPFLRTECSPFSAYGWVFAGVRFIRAGHSDCRPKDGEGDRKESEDKHCSTRIMRVKTPSKFIGLMKVLLLTDRRCGRQTRDYQNQQ